MRRPIALFLTGALLAGAAYGGWRYFGQPVPEAARADVAPAAPSAPGIAVVTAPVVREDFPIRRRSIGWIEPLATVVVKSRVDSQIVKQHVADGQFVKAGDLLFTLDDKELRATIQRDEAALARDMAIHIRTQADLRRKQELLAKNAGTQQLVDQAIADEKTAEANVMADEAALATSRLRLSYTTITAPIDGRVGAVQVTPGNLVRANDTTGLVTITQVKPIRVSFTLPERELAALRAAATGGKQPAVRVFTAGAKDKPVTGKLNFIDNSVDHASGTIIAKAIFPNEDLALWPGQYVDVEVDLNMQPKATVVPTVAVQVGQDGPFLYVVKPDGTADIRKLEVAATDGARTQILSGVEPGERVVVDGQLRLAQGVRVRETRAGETAANGKPASAKDRRS